MTYVIEFNDTDGNLTDVEYFDSQFCLRDYLTNRCGVDKKAAESPDGTNGVTPNGTIEWHPVFPDPETDYCMHCAECHDIMWHGIEECRHEDKDDN